jgi:hypothetical protein
MKKSILLLLAMLLFFSFFGSSLMPALAHVEMMTGDIRIVAGWTSEPPLVNQLNDIIVIVTNVSNDQPITNALAQVDITLNKGAQTRSLDFIPTEEAGAYTATLLPTQTGQYSLSIQGMIAGEAINNQVEIEDVEDTVRFAFPPATTTTTTATAAGGNQIPQDLVDQLQMIITDLTSQVEEANIAAVQANNSTQSVAESIEEFRVSSERSYLFSLIGVGAGVAGIAIGVVALSRKEKI